jgi:hypothetical protein
MGGSGDFFESADCVLMFDCYAVSDVTLQAKLAALSLFFLTYLLEHSLTLSSSFFLPLCVR